MINVLEIGWRDSNLYAVDNRYEILISVEISTIRDWYDIRRQLSKLGSIADLSVVSLTVRKGILKAQLSGSVEAVQLGLRQRGYALRQDTADGQYSLRLLAN